MLFADPSLVTRRLVDDVLKYKRIDGVTESLRTLRDGLLTDERVDLAELDVPVQIIWGEHDRVIARPGGEVRVIEGSGHSPHMESAAEVNDLIRQFVRD
jgi:pyruvate dehydrogenase E2 component (dihydrolipoamide acetyltransferase)